MEIDWFFSYLNKIQTLCNKLLKVSRSLILRSYHYLLLKCNALSIHIFYLLSISTLGFAILKALNPRTDSSMPSNIDVFFMSVSAATLSSMLPVEMEVFSDRQLVAMAVIMFLGGEIFTSMVGLHLNRMFRRKHSVEGRVESHQDSGRIETMEVNDLSELSSNRAVRDLRYDSIKFLGILVLVYLLVVQALGVASLLVYMSLFSSAENVLRKKQISMPVFAVFTVVSSFSNCGFIPTNENLIVFRENSGLLLILIPQILLGNTMFPSALRLIIWVMGKKKKNKKGEAKYLMENAGEVGYFHLLPKLHSLMLLPTAFGFLLVGFVLYSLLEWYATGLGSLNTYQKVVAVVFQCINTRHSGENIVDLSTVAPAVLLFFIVMMYLPPYTSFLPVKDDEPGPLKSKKKRSGWMFSHLSYLAIFIILVCISERKSLRDDPINFSVLNIAFEVTSAYGNVGLTTGYGCDRQLKEDPKCENKWYGLVGKWSDEAKLILILVMIFGRLKKFNIKGGHMWKLV